MGVEKRLGNMVRELAELCYLLTRLGCFTCTLFARHYREFRWV